jgi:hypothetical protein
MAIEALKHGKNVYSAVPMATDIEEIKEIVRLVGETGLTYSMGETGIYRPASIFCRQKYKSGEITVGDMKSAISLDKGERRVEIAGYIQALENANKSRSIVWRALHPFKNSTERREASLMKKTFVDGVGGENAYREIALAAYETFEGHKRANENLAVDMIRAKEELNRMVKMNEAMKESIVIDGFDRERFEERSSRVDQPAKAAVEKQL